jgi:hypothetical protein
VYSKVWTEYPKRKKLKLALFPEGIDPLFIFIFNLWYSYPRLKVSAVLISRHVRFWQFWFPDMWGSGSSGFQTCEVPAVLVSRHVRFRQFWFPDMWGFGSSGFQRYEVSAVLISRHVRFREFWFPEV